MTEAGKHLSRWLGTSMAQPSCRVRSSST